MKRAPLNISSETEKLLFQLRRELPDADLGHWSLESELARIQAACAGQPGFDAAIRAARESLAHATQLAVAFETLVRRLEELSIRKFRFSPVWWQQQRDEIQKESDEFRRLQKWARLVAEAAAMSESSVVPELLDHRLPLPESYPSLQQVCEAGIEVLLAERFDDAYLREMLTALIDLRSPGGESALEPAVRVPLLVFRARIHLYRSGDLERALKDFQEAQSGMPQSPIVLAALGEHQRKLGDRRNAEGFFQQTILSGPDVPFGYLGMGLSAEDQSKWSEADTWFDRAADRVLAENDPVAALGRMAAPVSGKAYLRLALKLQDIDGNRALDAVSRAESIGVLAGGNYPIRVVHAAKAEILERLGREEEAAEEYFNAGRNFHWDQDSRAAAVLLEKARSLDPHHAPTYWSLADAYLMLSYTEENDTTKRKLLSDAVDEWNEGMRLSRPDTNQSWIYLTRALICEQQTTLTGVDWKQKARRFWQCIVWVEQSLLLQNDRPLPWAMLTRYLRSLQLENHALEAISKGVAADPSQTDSSLLEERLIVVANAALSDEAETLVERYLTRMPGNAWAKNVKAFIKYHTGKYADAIALINETQDQARPDLWALEIRAICYALLSNTDAATKDFEQLLAMSDKPYQQSSRAFAAYQLGRYDEAIRLLEPLLPDPFERSLANRHLATCYLLQGDAAKAAPYIDETLRLSNKRELLEWLNVDLKRAKDRIPKPDFNRIVNAVQAQLAKLPVTRGDELDRVLRELNPDGSEHSWASVAVDAYHARVIAESLPGDALGIYRRLFKEPPLAEEPLPPFREASRGMEVQLDRLVTASDEAVKAGRTNDALTDLSVASGAVKVLRDNKRVRGIETRLAFVFFLGGDLDSAAKHLEAVLDVAGEPVSEVSEDIGNILKNLLEDAPTYYQLDDALAQRQSALPPGMRERVMSLREALAGYLEMFYGAHKPGDPFWQNPVVTPIAVELTSDLIPQDTADDEWPLLKTYIPEMRDRILRETGIKIPGVRVREQQSVYATQSFATMLNDIPVSPPEAVDQKPSDPDAWFAITRRLEAVLRSNLTEFVGLQEVEEKLEEWRKDTALAELIDGLLPDLTSRIRFTRLIRALVHEQVPVTRPADILRAVSAAGLPDDISTALRDVRLKLKHDLQGNQPGAHRIELPSDLENSMWIWLGVNDGRRSLAAPPEEVGEWMEQLRSLIPAPSETTAERRLVVLVTNDADLRLPLRRLVEYEFPGVMIISREELLEHESDTAAIGTLAHG